MYFVWAESTYLYIKDPLLGSVSEEEFTFIICLHWKCCDERNAPPFCTVYLKMSEHLSFCLHCMHICMHVCMCVFLLLCRQSWIQVQWINTCIISHPIMELSVSFNQVYFSKYTQLAQLDILQNSLMIKWQRLPPCFTLAAIYGPGCCGTHPAVSTVSGRYNPLYLIHLQSKWQSRS